jgi:DNA invertase Pin-like site-specific DNA recombinase
MSTKSTTKSSTVLGYVRVSTNEQHDAGAGLPAQIARLEQEAAGRGWTLEVVAEAGGRSGKSTAGREALAEALERLDRGEASTLVVSKLDRLCRSTLDFLSILERARRNGWTLVCLDVAIDTATPSGELMSTVLASFAQYERRLIAARTKEALAQRKAEGVVLGRPVVMLDEVRTRIHAERNAGKSLRAIAEGLNSEGIPTVHGGAQWHASTIQKALRLTVAA